jgi:MFS transporter, DHA1 family, inner membrane transport protein
MPLKQVVALRIVVLLGISCMFNSMDRQVFPALLSTIIPDLAWPCLRLASSAPSSLSWWLSSVRLAAGSWRGSGASRCLLAGLIAYSVFTFVTPFAIGFVTLAAYRTLTGAGEALRVGAVFACLGGYFGERRGTFMGIIHAFLACWAMVVVGAQIIDFTS